MKQSLLLPLVLMLSCLLTQGQPVRQRVCIDDGWRFAFGDASSPQKDFGCATEYFNYLTKANSIHNTGPYARAFDDTSWRSVRLPHDWAVDLPFAREASHSHGYKTVGWRYPQTSVGWYRRWLVLPEDDKGKRVTLTFDGIFRDARVWVNGFYCGGEPGGYLTQRYDITDYVTPGDSVLLCVRVDASLEEGWFYEGAGIYRHAWLEKSEPLHFADDGVSVWCDYNGDKESQVIEIGFAVANESHHTKRYECAYKLLDNQGNVVAQDTCCATKRVPLKPRRQGHHTALAKARVRPWSPTSPQLYTLRAFLYEKGENVADGKRERVARNQGDGMGRRLCDSVDVRTGFRSVRFDKDKGMAVNGEPLKLKGACLHQDHAGVGAAIPDELYVWRLLQLKSFGFNAIRSSHNPMSPALLDACDSLGFLVIEENRLLGVNDYHIGQLERMIRRDRNHPSIVAWSVGNEEWGVEWNTYGERIVRTMSDHVHRLDPHRPSTVATSGGPEPVKGADLAGYNYIMQNPIDEHRRHFPDRIAYCSEETTGCGTRGVYFHETSDCMPHYAPDQYKAFEDRNPSGRMPAFNRCADKDSTLNRIERGWRFQAEREWMCGLFYWTGFDYRGESNPLKYPATNSEFGIFDYCGFPKDEAYYLRAWWTDEPTLHLLPHWNLHGHEGEQVDVWAYSNCDEVELFQDGKSLGRKPMPRNGHLSWTATYRPGRLKAVGYRNGRKSLTKVVETTGEAVRVVTTEERIGHLTVLRIEARDAKNRFVPDACLPITISVNHNSRILGVGNGDPAWTTPERPQSDTQRTIELKTFNGLAQALLMSDDTTPASYEVTLKRMP